MYMRSEHRVLPSLKKRTLSPQFCLTAEETASIEPEIAKAVAEIIQAMPAGKPIKPVAMQSELTAEGVRAIAAGNEKIPVLLRTTQGSKGYPYIATGEIYPPGSLREKIEKLPHIYIRRNQLKDRFSYYAASEKAVIVREKNETPKAPYVPSVIYLSKEFQQKVLGIKTTYEELSGDTLKTKNSSKVPKQKAPADPALHEIQPFDKKSAQALLRHMKTLRPARTMTKSDLDKSSPEAFERINKENLIHTITYNMHRIGYVMGYKAAEKIIDEHTHIVARSKTLFDENFNALKKSAFPVVIGICKPPAALYISDKFIKETLNARPESIISNNEAFPEPRPRWYA